MAFNISSFAIPGMMPTTHPVADSIIYTDPEGAIDFTFSETEEAPVMASFRILDGAGKCILQDDAGDYYIRVGEENKFVFGDSVTGYLPVGTYFLWALVDGELSKFAIRNIDNAFNRGQNTGTTNLLVTVDGAPVVSEAGIGVYNWPTTITGDTFQGITLIRILVNGAHPSSPVASARIQFRGIRGSGGAAALELTTEPDGGILITDATEWLFAVPAFDVTMPKGTYYYDFETTDSESVIRTYLQGQWIITPDTTH